MATHCCVVDGLISMNSALYDERHPLLVQPLHHGELVTPSSVVDGLPTFVARPSERHALLVQPLHHGEMAVQSSAVDGLIAKVVCHEEWRPLLVQPLHNRQVASGCGD
jgi:hypothetical protein